MSSGGNAGRKKSTSRNAVWLRVIPLVLIAFSAAALCVQNACSSGTTGYTYTYH